MAFYASDTGDWIENIKNLLSDNWDSSNTDDTTPTIRLITDPNLPKKITLNRGDYILLYEEDSDETVADIGYYGVVKNQTVALDIRTNKGRTRLNKLYAEAENIIKTNRKNPTDTEDNTLGFSYLIWRGSTDLTNRQYRMWRFVASVEAHKPYDSVS